MLIRLVRIILRSNVTTMTQLRRAEKRGSLKRGIEHTDDDDDDDDDDDHHHHHMTIMTMTMILAQVRRVERRGVGA